jgi:hypothetical protein
MSDDSIVEYTSFYLVTYDLNFVVYLSGHHVLLNPSEKSARQTRKQNYIRKQKKIELHLSQPQPPCLLLVPSQNLPRGL